MALRSNNVAVGKSRTDTRVISKKIQKEIEEIINRYKGQKYITWTPQMDDEIINLHNLKLPVHAMVEVLGKLFPEYKFSYDRIYSRLKNLGLVGNRKINPTSYKNIKRKRRDNTR